MKFLFVASNQIGSRILRWGLDEPMSHLIIEFDTLPLKRYHSYGTGLQELTQDVFDSHGYMIIDSVELSLSSAQEIDAQQRFAGCIGYERYDYAAFAYFTWRAFLRKCFKIPLPKENPWGVADYDLCTESAYLAADIYATLTGKMILPPGHDLGITTPYALCTLLKVRMKDLNNA